MDVKNVDADNTTTSWTSRRSDSSHASSFARSSTRRTPSVHALLVSTCVTQMPDTGDAGGQTRERAAAVGQRRSDDAVHVRLARRSSSRAQYAQML